MWLFIPPIAFIIFLVIGYLIYRLGGSMGLKLKDEGGKLKTYACGEDIPGGKVQQTYDFFHVAFFFTILHVAVLMIATMPSGNIAIIGVIYLLVGLVSIIMLLRE